MRKIISTTILLFVCFLVHTDLLSQVSLSGPGCVLPGMTYEYTINAKWDSASKMQVCLTGGVIAGSSNTCSVNGAPQSFVLVIWDSIGVGAIKVKSSKGDTTLNIGIVSNLTGGTMNSSLKSQQVKYNIAPSAVTCTASTGGSCSPTYTYQWQQSSDILTWTDIAGATGQNYTAPGLFKRTVFLRRKVTETSSGSIAYSDVALVDVWAPTVAGQ